MIFKHNKFIVALGLAATLLVMSSCQNAPPKTALDAQGLSQAETTLASLRQKYDWQGLLAFGQVRVRGGGKSESFDAALLVQSPDLVTLEIINDLGQVLTRVVSDGHQILYEDTQQKIYTLLGDDTAAFKKALHLPISPQEFVARLLLKIPQEKIVGVGVQKNAVTGAAVKQVEGENYLIGFDEKNQQLLEVRRWKTPGSGKELYRIEYLAKPDAVYPGQIVWRFQKPKVEVTVRFEEVTRKDSSPPQKFDTHPPEGWSSGEIR